MTRIQALIRDGVPADAPEAQDAARCWIALMDPHVKRNPHLTLKLDALYREEPAMQAATGTDPALFQFVERAAAHYRLGLYARHLEPAQFASMRERYLNQPGGAWVVLCRDLRALMEAGVAPSDPAAGAVCARWRMLFEQSFGSDPDVRARVLHAQATDPLLNIGSSWDGPSRAYLRAGLAQLDALDALDANGACHA